MAQRPWTEDEIRRAVAMRQAGVELTDIGAVLDRSASSVENKLQKLGVKLSDEQRRAILERNNRCLVGHQRRRAAEMHDRNPDASATIALERAYLAAAKRNGWLFWGKPA